MTEKAPARLTAAALAELAALEQTATPGPWRWQDVDTWPSEWGHSGPDLVTVSGHSESCPHYCMWRDEAGVEHRGKGPKEPHEHFYEDKIVASSWGYDADGISVDEADAALIAALRNAAPALLAEITRLRAPLADADLAALLRSWVETYGNVERLSPDQQEIAMFKLFLRTCGVLGIAPKDQADLAENRRKNGNRHP